MKKKKGWTTTKLITASSIGVVMLVFSLFGGVLNAATGIGGAGGIINVFVQGGLTTFVVLAIKQFGSATIAWLALSILAIPLPIIGPTGFFLKIVNGLFIGICSDTAYFLFKKYEKLAGILVGGVNTVAGGITFLAIGILGIKWTGIVEITLGSLTFPKAIIILLLSFSIGMVAGYLGWAVYNKLRDAAVIKRIQKDL